MRVILVVREYSFWGEIKIELIGIFWWVVFPTIIDIALLYFLFHFFKK
jgi:hypothetical protein